MYLIFVVFILAAHLYGIEELSFKFSTSSVFLIAELENLLLGNNNLQKVIVSSSFLGLQLEIL